VCQVWSLEDEDDDDEEGENVGESGDDDEVDPLDAYMQVRHTLDQC